MNDILWRAVKRAHIMATKEPANLIFQNGKRPDGSMLIPWSRGKPMAWDVTVPDTYAESHIGDTVTEAGAATNQAAASKIAKYIASTHILYPVAIVTLGCRACPGNRQTGHINHWRTQRIHLSVSAVVNSPTEGKCGRLSQHF